MRGYEGVRGPAYDPAAAKKLLAEAGFSDGKGFPKVELVYNTNELHRVVTQAIQQMWKEKPNTFLDMWVSGGGNNQTGWSSKRYDELIAKAGCGTADPRERMKLLAEAEKILVVDEAPIMPLYTYVNKGLLSRKVKGWHPNILDQHPLKAISLER
jgi:oligopeptide transport system substrate-binding protein